MFDSNTQFETQTRPATTAVLDRPRPAARDLGPELDVLRLGFDAGLAAVLPRMSFDLRNTPMVVTDLVDGRPAAEFVADGATLEPEVAAAIGSAIGAWHAGSAGHAHRFRVAPDTPPGTRVACDPLLGSALAALSQEWTSSTVMHGDCGVDHAVVTAEPDGAGGARVVLTGWGRSGVGDPAWDVGCLVADLLADGTATGTPSRVEPSMAAALAAYGRVAGAAVQHETFARRVALCVVARLVASALETSDPALLGLARSVAAWLPNWTMRFERWLA